MCICRHCRFDETRFLRKSQSDEHKIFVESDLEELKNGP